LDEAWAIVDRVLSYDDPSFPLALALGSKIWFKQKKHAVAYQFARRLADKWLAEIYPNEDDYE
jgi:predicted nucleic acid-binding protein